MSVDETLTPKFMRSGGPVAAQSAGQRHRLHHRALPGGGTAPNGGRVIVDVKGMERLRVALQNDTWPAISGQVIRRA